MKTFNIYIIGLILAWSSLSVSCNKWLDLKPQDGLVADDFWQTKEQIRSAVNGIYISLIATMDHREPIADNLNLVHRGQLSEYLFLHGEMRADMIELSPFTMQYLDEYRYANLISTNRTAYWWPFYKIINYCNHVIDNAPAVKNVDPTLTQVELDAYIGEALTIRAWMYLCLARTWGDVPLKLSFTASDDESFNLRKSPQDEVLAAVVADLVRAEPMVKETFGGTAALDKGKVTKYTVYALMADAYLWQNDYPKALEACNKIINSGKFSLVPGNPSTWLSTLFAQGNSSEGIFELQYDRQQLNTFYTMFYLNPVYLSASSVHENLFMMDTDNPENFDVRANRGAYDASTGQIYKYLGVNREVRKQADESFTHWMVYRYADVLLMKAEALNGLRNGAEALELIYEVRERANALSLNDMTPHEDDNESITNFLLAERAREFAYEGKRWFDVLRHARRDNYARLDLITNMVLQYAPTDRQQSMLAKYRNANSHYLPIYFTELQTNKDLMQNPFYNN